MDISNFPRHCGTKIVSNFWNYKQFQRCSTFTNTFIGIFVDAAEQRKSYVKMCKKYKVLYQSPILKRGPGNGNDYFIVIWLNEKP